MRTAPPAAGHLVALAVALLATVAHAQEPVPAAASAPGPADAYDRGVPRSAVRGYLVACRASDWESAAEYLDLRRLPPAARSERGPALARHLKIVLDRTLWIDLDELSASAAGVAGDGLLANRDRLGRIEARGGPVELFLERVPRAEDGVPVWKISAASVARIPALYEEFGYGVLAEWLPAPLVEIRVLEVQLWQWIGLALVAPLSWGLAWLAVWTTLAAAGPLLRRRAPHAAQRLLPGLRAPVRLLVASGLFATGTLALGLSVPAERVVVALARGVALGALAWAAFRMVDVGSASLAEKLAAARPSAAAPALAMGRRAAKALVAALAVLAVLHGFGVNVTALVAGLGFGGLALALGAQKTLENLFGGVTLLADQPVRVGDFCRFGERVGTIEEIGLRSTRVRTLDRTVVTIPNADFSTLALENFARRDRIWYHPRLGLRYETTPDQLRFVLVEIRRMLYAHPKVDADPARVRFVGFGESSLDLEVFAYVQVTDFGEFLEVAEDLNLRIMHIVERGGTGFAFPSRTLYLGKDAGLDAERRRAAEERVGRWRERNELPLPGFTPQAIQELRGTLEYPSAGSALRRA